MMDKLGTITDGPGTGRPLLLRPPLLFAAAIMTAIVLHFAWPLSFMSRAVRWPVGVTLSVAGFALVVAAIREFDSAGTPVPARRPTTAIVRSGPYRFSRNP